jgi:hypothetical protein
MTSLNSNSVKDVAHSSPTAEGMFLDLNDRQRFRATTNLNHYRKQLIRKGIKFVEEDFLNTFKKLEQLGVGALSYGRKGNPDIFKWYYSLKDIAKMGVEGKELNPKEIDLKVPSKRSPVTKKLRVRQTAKGAYIQIIIPKELMKHVKVA